jgi:hypothetical protein
MFNLGEARALVERMEAVAASMAESAATMERVATGIADSAARMETVTEGWTNSVVYDDRKIDIVVQLDGETIVKRVVEMKTDRDARR